MSWCPVGNGYYRSVRVNELAARVTGVGFSGNGFGQLASSWRSTSACEVIDGAPPATVEIRASWVRRWR